MTRDLVRHLSGTRGVGRGKRFGRRGVHYALTRPSTGRRSTAVVRSIYARGTKWRAVEDTSTLGDADLVFIRLTHSDSSCVLRNADSRRYHTGHHTHQGCIPVEHSSTARLPGVALLAVGSWYTDYLLNRLHRRRDRIPVQDSCPMSSVDIGPPERVKMGQVRCRIERIQEAYIP